MRTYFPRAMDSPHELPAGRVICIHVGSWISLAQEHEGALRTGGVGRIAGTSPQLAGTLNEDEGFG